VVQSLDFSLRSKFPTEEGTFLFPRFARDDMPSGGRLLFPRFARDDMPSGAAFCSLALLGMTCLVCGSKFRFLAALEIPERSEGPFSVFFPLFPLKNTLLKSLIKPICFQHYLSVYKKDHTYFIYIVTNPNRSTLYTGVTNNLISRLAEHWSNRGNPETFAGKYYCHNLIYYETFQYILTAIAREKEIKKWNRKKKENLIASTNPNWTFLNEKICGSWPPKNVIKRR
jgi:putative endonuclease